MKEETFVVEVVFNRPVKLPYDELIREDICYTNVIDHEIICVGRASFLKIVWGEDDILYINYSDILAIQVNVNKFEDEEEIKDASVN